MESIFVGLIVFISIMAGFYLGRFSQPCLGDEKDKLWRNIKNKIGLREKTQVISPSKLVEGKKLIDDSTV